MELQSEKIDALAKALSAAQGLIESAQKDGSNPHFKSSYATLDSIWTACRKPLANNGLAVVQTPMSDEAGLSLITTLCHESGQWMRSVLRVDLVNNNAQGVGSALTYMRRYALAAMVGVAPSDDDDGETASGNGQFARSTQQPQVRTAQAPISPSAPKPTSTPGNAPTSPQGLLDQVNGQVAVKYDNVNHLFNAIKSELPEFKSFPPVNRPELWQDAYMAALKHAQAKQVQPEPTKEPEPVAPADDFPF